MLDFKSFLLGYSFCLLSDVVLSIATWFIQRSFYYRNYRKMIEVYNNEKK